MSADLRDSNNLSQLAHPYSPLPLPSIVEQQELGVLRAQKEKFNVEFNRYKQDCRKRALELAHSNTVEYRKSFLTEDLKDNEGKIIPKEIAQENILIALADKYYNWLISIEN